MSNNYPLALPDGTILAGQYIIESTLGQGGFGITYKASDHKTGNTVAIKEFFPEALATRTQNNVVPFDGERGENYKYGKDCFVQEAQTLAQFIGNENIVKIYSYFEENGTAYFVMEYVEGISFEEYIKKYGGKINYEVAENILMRVIDALDAVHSKGIVHRDVTPDNIYLTSDGKVKLIDFGAARYSIGDKSRSLDVVLKHGFAPKEQYTRHGKQGPYTDVYTLGACFYYALTGKRPPDSIDRIEIDDLVPPSNMGVQLQKHKEDAILKALSVQPTDRFQTVAQFKSALCGEMSVVNNSVINNSTNNIQYNSINNVSSHASSNYNTNVNGNDNNNDNNNKSFLPFIGIGIIICLSLIIGLLVFMLIDKKGDNDENLSEKDYIKVEETTTKNQDNTTDKETTKKQDEDVETTEKVTTEKKTTEEKTTEKETTEEVTTTKKENVSYEMGYVDYLTVSNISNGGCGALNNKVLSRVFANMLAYYDKGTNTWVAIDIGDKIGSVNTYADGLVYVKDGKVKYWNGSEISDIEGCDRGTDEIYSIYVMESEYGKGKGNGAFVVSEYNSKVVVEYFSWTNHFLDYFYYLQNENLITFVGEDIYFINNNILCKIGIENFNTGAVVEIVYDLSEEDEIINMVSDGKYIYIFTYDNSSKKNIILRFDIKSGNCEMFTLGFDDCVGAKINVYNDEVYIVFNNTKENSALIYTCNFNTKRYKKVFETSTDYSIIVDGISIFNEETFILSGYNMSNNKRMTISTYTEDGVLYGGVMYDEAE